MLRNLMNSKLDAKTFYPVHTEHPDAYAKVSDKITIIDEGVKYEIN